MRPAAPRYATLLLAALAPHAAAQALFTDGESVGGDAAAGQSAYAVACASCHGARLEGTPFAPTLTGQAYVNKWRGKPAAELLKLMRETMPPRGTGSVKPEIFPDLLAFMVEANVKGRPLAMVAPAPPSRSASPRRRESQERRLAPAQARLLSGLSPVTSQMLAAPPDGDWLMWRRTFDATGFSPLAEIDRGNVQRLGKAWSLRLDPSGNEITPLVHDGVLFVYSGASLRALDAANGKPLWEYRRESPRAAAGAAGFDAGRRSRVRSMAIQGHALFLPTADGWLLALDARNGELIWERSIRGEAPDSGLQLSSGPLVANGVVIIGASLGLANKGGCFIVGLDAATGQERWRFQTVAPPGLPGGDSWNGAPADERFGGGVWTTGSYDPGLDLVFFGVGNTYTTATLLEPRPGASGVSANDGLYTNATIALRPVSGELVWHHQHHRRDVWDQDWAFEQTLVTLGEGADARRAVVTGGKTGVFTALDAATGRFLFAQDTGLTNLFVAVDPRTGEKRINPALEPAAGQARLLCPGNLGARNWPATSFNAGSGVLFVPMLETCAEFTYAPRSREETAAGGSDIRFSPRQRPGSDGKLGRVMALDVATQRVLWTQRQRMPVAGSLLATAGGLLFMGDLDRRFSAWDQDSGAMLWQTRLPAAAESTPISYAVEGRQYVAVVAGETSHLGVNNRRLVEELGEPNSQLELVVFALR